MKFWRKTRRLRRPSPRAVGWIGVLAVVAAVEVWLHLKTTELGYELGLIRQVSLRLVGERGELEAELATLTSPRALDMVARTRFGLRPPQQGQVMGLP